MMKHIVCILSFMLALFLPLAAEEMTTDTIALPTLQCGMCKKTIEKKVSKHEGLESIKVDVESKVATVVYDATITDIAAIENAIAKAGYAANKTAADETAQSKLHACCRPGAHE